MHTLHRILRRSHCRNTNQLFAIDALPLVQTPAGKRLARLLLRYPKQYLTGASDPDTRICDFQNQIIHVEDGYWGGGPRVASQWYNRLLQSIEQKQYAAAAQAAGILSHYFTDALQPLHTGETKREAIVHLPLERSFYRSYDIIRNRWIDNPLRAVFRLTDEPDWLRSAMLQGAQMAHQKFSLLVNSYRFDAGVDDAMAGFDELSRIALADLLGLSVTGWARIIERAGRDVENRLLCQLPTSSMSLPLVAATLRSPFECWQSRYQQRRLDRQIKMLANEYRKKGYLKKYLPHDVDIKQRVNQVRRDEKAYQATLIERAKARFAEEEPTANQSETIKTIRIDSSSHVIQHQYTNEDQYPIDGRLLVAAGWPTTAQLATANDRLLHAELLRLALTSAGQRILQGRCPPTLAQVRRTIATAKAYSVA